MGLLCVQPVLAAASPQLRRPAAICERLHGNVRLRLGLWFRWDYQQLDVHVHDWNVDGRSADMRAGPFGLPVEAAGCFEQRQQHSVAIGVPRSQRHWHSHCQSCS